MCHAFQAKQIIGTSRQGDFSVKRLSRLRLYGGNGNCATYRVSSEQRALRASQHFQPININDIEDSTDRSRHVDAVNIETNTGFSRWQELLLADPSQINRRGIRRTAETGVIFQRQARRKLSQFVETGNAAIVQ